MKSKSKSNCVPCDVSTRACLLPMILPKGSVIKPVVKLIKSFFCQEAGGTVVKVRIKLMDDTFEPQDGKQPGGE